MSDDKPQLTLVDNNFKSDYEQEFAPLPYMPWDERPSTAELTQGEAATALFLAHGDDHAAARLLKVPYVRLSRLIRGSLRLQRTRDECLGETTAAAASVAIRTLFDPSSDRRQLEWASTKVLQSRMAAGHSLSPAPPTTVQSNVTVNQADREIVFRWKSPSTGEVVDADE